MTTIPLKFEVGQRVWVIFNNTVQETFIDRITIFVCKYKINIEYFVVCGGCKQYFTENRIFPTKEELLNSL
jgi:hypothetical protein